MKQKTSKRTPHIEVCHGPKCSDFGSRELSKELNGLGIRSSAGDCRSQCPHAPVVFIDDRMVPKATVEKVMERSESTKKEPSHEGSY